MVVLTIVFAVLLLILTGMFWPALVASAWVVVAVIAVALFATWLLSFFRDAMVLFSLATPARTVANRTGAEPNAPRPGDADWLDWANREGKYEPRPRA